MWPTTTRNRDKSGTPGRGNEIWEGLRPLSFFSFAPPPHPRPGVAPAPTPYLRAVRAARPGRMARPAVPARGYRPSACPLRRPYGRPRDQKECGGMKIARLARAAPRRALAPGGWWLSGPGGVGPGPPWAVAGLPRSVFAAARSAGGAAPPARLRAVLGAGPGGTAGRPPCGLTVPPVAAVWSLGAFLPPRVGRAALGLPWPVPAWGAVIGWPGAPQRPGGRDGRGPLSGARAVVLFGLVPCRRRSGPRFSSRAGQRWKKAVRCPARGGLDSAACGRRGTAGGINAPGWWIENERHP